MIAQRGDEVGVNGVDDDILDVILIAVDRENSGRWERQIMELEVAPLGVFVGTTQNSFRGEVRGVPVDEEKDVLDTVGKAVQKIREAPGVVVVVVREDDTVDLLIASCQPFNERRIGRADVDDENPPVREPDH